MNLNFRLAELSDIPSLLDLINHSYRTQQGRSWTTEVEFVKGDIDGTLFVRGNEYKKFEDRIDPSDRLTVDVLEATQFIRMLPFKCAAGETEKAMFFYVHACYLLSRAFG